VTVAGDLHGTALPTPAPRPDFVLRGIDGGPYAFGPETQGRLTLLFFGYTHCPDVCPATMENLAAATARLTPTERLGLRVVFVTTDPERDTPERLGPWLAALDPDFIGLTGTIDDVIAAQRAAGVAPAVRDADGPGYTISHAAQVIVVSPDDTVRVVYPFGIRQAEWAEDLPRLLATPAVGPTR
jgi:protein SCO1/2